MSYFPGVPGPWAMYCFTAPLRNPFRLGGFTARLAGTGWVAEIPFWFPSLLLGLIAWIAWTKTRETARGFPVEPLASRRENTGG